MSIMGSVLEGIYSLPLILQILFFVVALNAVIALVFYGVMRLTEKDDVVTSKHFNKQ